MISTDTALDRVCLYVYGELSLEAFQSALHDAPALETFLGKTEYLDLSSLGQGATSEAVRARVRELFERRFPGRLLGLRARQLCEQMISGARNVLVGLREMTALYHQPEGDKIIPVVFVGLASETDGLPSPEQYPRWDERALQAHLLALDRYKPAIIEAARGFLAQPT